MKTLYKLLIVGVVVVFGLTGCPRGLFDPYLGGAGDGTQDTETALIDQANADESSSNPGGDPFNYGNATGTLTDAADQEITVTFNNGVVDTDENGAIPGLTIYELDQTAAATAPYGRGGPVAYDALVVYDNSGDSTVTLTLDLSSVVSTLIEISMDPELLTADNGAALLNEDEDDVPGEAGEDAAVAYLAVGGGTTDVPTGVARDPRDGVTYVVPGAPAASDTTFVIAGVDTNSPGYQDAFSATSLGGGFSIWNFDPATVSWTEEDVTATYDGAGSLTLTMSDPVAVGEVFQIRRDRYMIMSADPVLGFVQREMTDQNDVANRYARSNLLVETGSTVASADSVSDHNYERPAYMDVNFGGVGDIVLETVTNDSVRFILDENNNNQDFFQLPFESVAVLTDTDGDNTLRFYFSLAFDPQTDYHGYDVYVYPSVRDDNTTPSDTSDDLHVINTGEQESGVTVLSGTVWF